jgi:regulator of sigma E protease
MTIIYFIITLGILIFMHEFGHFIMAKRAGIRVDAFSFGFGPRLFGLKVGETDYRVSLLPLGGYVNMYGEDPHDEGSNDPRSFDAKPVWSRIKVVSMGPIMNLLLCLVLMPIVFMIGRVEPTYLHEPPVVVNVKEGTPAAEAGLLKDDLIVSIDGDEVDSWESLLNRIMISPNQDVLLGVQRGGSHLDVEAKVAEMPEIKGGYLGIEPMFFLSTEARVDGVQPGSPAEMAGLKAGDMIVSFNGKSVTDFYDFSAQVNSSGGAESELTIVRKDKKKEIKIRPTYSPEAGRWIVGVLTNRVGIGPQKLFRYGFYDSIRKGLSECVKLTSLTLSVLYKLITFKLSYKVLGGPIVIAKVSAEAAASGLGQFLYFMAFLSLQLAILNFLPIPVLDGGHLVFCLTEALRRKPLSIRFRGMATQVGFIVLVAFMVLVTYKDIDSMWGVSVWVKRTFNL